MEEISKKEDFKSCVVERERKQQKKRLQEEKNKNKKKSEVEGKQNLEKKRLGEGHKSGRDSRRESFFKRLTKNVKEKEKEKTNRREKSQWVVCTLFFFFVTLCNISAIFIMISSTYYAIVETRRLRSCFESETAELSSDQHRSK